MSPRRWPPRPSSRARIEPIEGRGQDVNNSVHTANAHMQDLGFGHTAKQFLADVMARCCAFRRVWCIVELCEALERHIPVVMLCGGSENGKFLPNTSSLLQLYALINIRQATCSVSADKVRILGEVAASVGFGGYELFARGCIAGASAARIHPLYRCAALGDWSALAKIEKKTTIPRRSLPHARRIHQRRTSSPRGGREPAHIERSYRPSPSDYAQHCTTFVIAQGFAAATSRSSRH